MLTKLALLVAALALVPTVTSAQTATNWNNLRLSALPTIHVLDDTGQETRGTLLRFEPSALILLVDGTERSFEAARVRRIEKKGDSLRNGAIIGAIVGVVFGLIGAGMSDCPGDDPGGSCPGARAALFLFSTGAYAAIGTGVDALLPGRTLLYEAPAVSRIAPRAGNAGTRLAFHTTVRW